MQHGSECVERVILHFTIHSYKTEIMEFEENVKICTYERYAIIGKHRRVEFLLVLLV